MALLRNAKYHLSALSHGWVVFEFILLIFQGARFLNVSWLLWLVWLAHVLGCAGGGRRPGLHLCILRLLLARVRGLLPNLSFLGLDWLILGRFLICQILFSRFLLVPPRQGVTMSFDVHVHEVPRGLLRRQLRHVVVGRTSCRKQLILALSLSFPYVQLICLLSWRMMGTSTRIQKRWRLLLHGLGHHWSWILGKLLRNLCTRSLVDCRGALLGQLFKLRLLNI